VFFVTMVVVLNLALWVSGSGKEEEIPTERGYLRYVPDLLGEGGGYDDDANI
jgi:hypothetical protein